MNLYSLFIFFFFNTPIQEHLPQFIDEYHKVSSKEEELCFINKYQSNKEVKVKAYVVSLKMKQAKYKIFPWQKLSIFNKERKKLNTLIKLNPKNIHLRYIRLLSQENTPKYLGYNNFIKEDKEFLKSKLKVKDKTDYLDRFIVKNTSL